MITMFMQALQPGPSVGTKRQGVYFRYVLFGVCWLAGWPLGHSAEFLVRSTDAWHLRPGVSAPQADWKTAVDTGLDRTWSVVPGGFGYADNSAETAACATILSDMRNSYSTVYVRRSFEVTADMASELVLTLNVDWDDGFIAWLDGNYLASRNVPSGTAEPSFGQTAPANHESSRGNSSPLPAENFTVGMAIDWLPVGTHTLAVMGLNTSLSSSDFVLIPNLLVEEPASPSTNVVSGTLIADTTWAATNSPYHVVGNVTVGSGATLRIEPGVKVEFDQGLGLTVEGRLLAEGTEVEPIAFVPAAGATSWGRIRLNGGAQESRIAHATLDGAAGRGNITADRTSLYLDHVVFTNTLTQLVTVDDTSIDIRHCVFPSISNDELLHFLGMPDGGHALVISNYFGTTSGYNDTIDFTGGNRPGPIAQFIGNVFDSAVDDCLDMDGTDAHIEGNIFLNVRQDATRDSSSNPISTGADGGQTSELVIARNIFVNCEHSLLLKDAGSALMQNNTILTIAPNPLASQPAGIINFTESNQGTPVGRGALFEGNIVWDLQADPWVNFNARAMFLEVSHSIIQDTSWPGTGNLSDDPMFVNPTGLTWDNVRERLALQPGSPALGSGPNGLDMGALVPSGPSIQGEPPLVTTNTSAVLTVAGPGVYAYKWKLNNGPWSEEMALTHSLLIEPTMFDNAPPITLSDLRPGTYQVSVIGKNSAGSWQSELSPTRSRTWTVMPPDGGGVVQVGGVLAEDTTWGPESGEIWVMAPLEIPAGVTLSIEPGTVVKVAAGTAIQVSNGEMRVGGTPDRRVTLSALDGSSAWGPIEVSGARARFSWMNVELAQGSVFLRDGVEAELVDCTLRDFVSGSTPIVHTLRPGRFLMRRCHVTDYYEVLSQLAVSVIEDCLFENIQGDGFDFDGARPGSFMRSSTFRHGAAVNVDALDVGNYSDGTVSEGVTVENCLIVDFPFDKGVSIGEHARDVVVRDCVIVGVDTGVAVKDSSQAQLLHNTVVAANHGFRLYEKNAGQGGGYADTWNNILWDNGSALTLDSLSTVTVGWSDVEGGYAGEQNLNVDPLFRNAAAADYRLLSESPVRGQGREGEDLGARFPVGSSLVDTDGDGLPDPWELGYELDFNTPDDAEMDPDADGLDNRSEYWLGTSPQDASSALALAVEARVDGTLALTFDAVAWRSYGVEFSDDAGGSWTELAQVPQVEVDGRVVLTDTSVVGGSARWYRVRLMDHP